ncbi:MAG: ExsB family protein [Legionellaceae bacterium]|nr:ExsB family protein [Legionellaceae bacterium]
MAKVCAKCVMDMTDPAITFNEQGVCCHCIHAQERLKNEVFPGAEGEKKLAALCAKIKQAAKSEPYDCVIGLSGGVDSSYLAYLVKEKYGLRPLAVHFDNGWNSELAVSNIERLVKGLGIDYYNYVMDWEVFKNLQLAFLKSSLANAEIPTDHAIFALLFQQAAKHNIKYILLGGNVSTESIMPDSWMCENRDWRLIKAINQRFGGKRLSNYPHFSLLKMAYYVFVKKIKCVSILNYTNYVKSDAKQLLVDRYGWRDYGGKHYESIYTKFFQTYILPRKFNIDKRKAHLSSLINASQITREEAMQELAKPLGGERELESDKEYVLKKLGLSEEEFDNIMKAPVKHYEEYPNSAWLFVRSKKMMAKLKALIGAHL